MSLVAGKRFVSFGGATSLQAPLVFAGFSGGGGGGVETGDAETDAYLAAAGVTNAAAGTAFKDMIVGLRTDLGGADLTASGFDRLFSAANQSAAGAITDLCGNASGALVNGPTFVPWRGLTGPVGGSGIGEGHFNSNFNELNDGANYSATGRSFFFYMHEGNFDAGADILCGVVQYVSSPYIERALILNEQGGGGAYFCDTSVSGQDFLNAKTFDRTSPALWMVCSNETNSLFYRNGELIGDYLTDLTVFDNAALLDQDFLFMGQSAGDGSVFTVRNPCNFGLMGLGRYFDASEVAAISDRINTAMSALYSI